MSWERFRHVDGFFVELQGNKGNEENRREVGRKERRTGQTRRGCKRVAPGTHYRILPRADAPKYNWRSSHAEVCARPALWTCRIWSIAGPRRRKRFSGRQARGLDSRLALHRRADRVGLQPGADSGQGHPPGGNAGETSEALAGKLLYVYDRHDAFPEYDGKRTTAVQGVYITVEKK